MAFWLGIDVAKTILEIASSESGATWQVPNTPDGWHAVTARYAEAPPTGVVMEATGALHVGLHLHLSAAGWHSSVMTPKWIADYAGSRGRLGKTDRVDARLLARYGSRETPAPTPVKSPAPRRVMALIRRRSQVAKLRVMNLNQAASSSAPRSSAPVTCSPSPSRPRSRGWIRRSPRSWRPIRDCRRGRCNCSRCPASGRSPRPG